MVHRMAATKNHSNSDQRPPLNEGKGWPRANANHHHWDPGKLLLQVSETRNGRDKTKNHWATAQTRDRFIFALRGHVDD